MSKFIAMLCAAAMLMSASCIALADDIDESITDETYDEYREESTEPDGTTEFDAPYTDVEVGDDYVDTSETGIKVVESTTDKKEETKEEVKEEVKEETEVKKDGSFTDVPLDAYYADAVKFCYERGLFNGMTDTEFAPDVTMTRGMFATVFGRIQKADLTNVTLTFTDVNPDAYYASYIAWATQEGIMDGYSDTAFGPDDAITREQAAKMLQAYLANVKNIAITDVAADYADIDSVSDWAKAAINANTSVGYLRADENNNINPTAKLTRADACYAVATTIRLVETLEAEGIKD